MSDKVAIVTGSAQGIGNAIAKRFVDDGFTVLVVDVDGEAAARAARELSAGGGTAEGLTLDVTDGDGWQRAVARAAELGDFEVLVNNAGIVRDSTLRKMTDEMWDDVIRVHLLGTFLGSRAALRAMVERGGGRIVNISSIAYLGAFGQANYAAAKGGIVSFTKTLALEGAKYGVLANAVAPGNTDTAMFATIPEPLQQKFIDETPVKRLADPSEIASVVRFLTSEDASYVTGQVIHVDGGVTATT